MGRAYSMTGRRALRMGYWWESQKENDHYEYQEVDGLIMLRWISEKYYGLVWTGLLWFRIATSSCGQGSESSGSVKCWEVLEQLHNWRPFELSSAPWSELLIRSSVRLTNRFRPITFNAARRTIIFSILCTYLAPCK
jgi:hypothetical protein